MWGLLLLSQHLRAVDLDLDLGAKEKTVCGSMPERRVQNADSMPLRVALCSCSAGYAALALHAPNA